MEVKTFSELERLNDYLRNEGSRFEIQLIRKDVLVLKEMGLKLIK